MSSPLRGRTNSPAHHGSPAASARAYPEPCSAGDSDRREPESQYRPAPGYAGVPRLSLANTTVFAFNNATRGACAPLGLPVTERFYAETAFGACTQWSQVRIHA